MLQGIELEKAQNILLQKVELLNTTEKLEIIKAHERVLAEDIYSNINQPPFNRSPLDGYTFRAEDSKGASREKPVILNVIDEVLAGYCTKKEVIEKTAVRIMTGAPIPKGANCVVRQESVDYKEGKVKIFSEFAPWDNVCFKGEDLKNGELILKKGTTLKYGEIGILAIIGIGEIRVYKKPIISVLSTGDEIKDIGQELMPGQIYNSNLYCISSRIKECFCKPLMMGSTKDNIKDMCIKIKEAVDKSDIVITTGGVSVGKKDIVKDVIKELGGEILFWKVNIKPGSALLCSILKGKLIISLSGNPGAAITAFELIVRPILAKVTGIKELELRREKGVLSQEFPKKSKTRRFVRAKITYTEHENIIKLTQVAQGNGILSSILNSNCLIDVKAGSEALKKGETVEVRLL